MPKKEKNSDKRINTKNSEDNDKINGFQLGKDNNDKKKESNKKNKDCC